MSQNNYSIFVQDANTVKLLHARLLAALKEKDTRLEYIETTIQELENIPEGATWYMLGLQRELIIRGLNILAQMEEQETSGIETELIKLEEEPTSEQNRSLNRQLRDSLVEAAQILKLTELLALTFMHRQEGSLLEDPQDQLFDLAQLASAAIGRWQQTFGGHFKGEFLTDEREINHIVAIQLDEDYEQKLRALLKQATADAEKEPPRPNLSN